MCVCVRVCVWGGGVETGSAGDFPVWHSDKYHEDDKIDSYKVCFAFLTTTNLVRGMSP